MARHKRGYRRGPYAGATFWRKREERRQHVGNADLDVASMVQAARMDAGLTQAEAAAALGIARGKLAKIETARAGVQRPVLEKMAETYRAVDLLARVRFTWGYAPGSFAVMKDGD